jgi:hypothetical protein
MVSIISAAALLYVVYIRKNDTWRIYKLCLLADIVILGFVVAVRTHSNTPFGGLAAFIAVLVFWEVLRKSPLKSCLSVASQARMVYSGFVSLALIFAAVALVRTRSSVVHLVRTKTG